jgi:hypothetical protein
LLAQLPHTSVVRRCGCGCATVDLHVDRAAVAPATVGENPVAEASFAVDDANVSGGVLLFAEDGYLSYLEVYSVQDKPITRFPEPRLLRLDS